jgi:hypothetical protein
MTSAVLLTVRVSKSARTREDIKRKVKTLAQYSHQEFPGKVLNK